MIDNPNPQQKQSLEAEGDLIVSAAAGSGKTAVMVARVARLVIEGCDIRKILMVTFTNAAAAEMKQRIKADLAKAALQGGADARRLRRQMSLVDNADISTVHSFCIRLVRQYFGLAGVDPLFRMCGETEGAVYRQQAMDELMDEMYNGGQYEHFKLLIKALAGGYESQLRSLVAGTYDYAMASPDPGQWLQRSVDIYADTDDIAHKAAQAVDELREQVIPPLERAAYLAYGQIPALTAAGAKSVEQLAELYTRLAKRCAGALEHGASMAAIHALPDGAEIAAPKRLKGFDDAALDEIKQLLAQAKAAIKGAGENPLFNPGADMCAAQQRDTGIYARGLRDLVQLYGERFAAIKMAANVIDFTDAEHMAYSILQDEDARREVSEKYSYVFVDEYQDTNDLQEAIISLVARPGTLFCVGDVKQSIYAFRHAEPSIFMHRYDNAGEDGRIDLNRNYRSNPGIISAINAVFERGMTRSLGGVDYDETHRLHAGLEGGRNKAELALVLREGNARQGAQAQAVICAQRIEQLLEEQFEDKDGPRNYKYSDIAILLPALVGNGSEFMDTLISCGIPVVGSARSDFYSESEVSAVLCILRLLDNGMDDLSLIGALRSPAGRFSAADLARLRLVDRERPLYEVAAEHSGQQGDIPKRLRAFYDKINRWQRMAMTAPVHELVSDIIDTSGMAASYALMPDGEAQVGRLDTLVRRASEFSAYSSGGLNGFLQLVDMQGGTADRVSQPASTGDSVNVMTIHGSKGLEFPVVIYALADRAISKTLQERNTAGAVLDKNMGIGLQYYNAELDARGDTLLRTAMREHKRQGAYSEQMRLLYVALTRAKQRLIVLASQPEKDYMNALSLPPHEGDSSLHWILPAAVDIGKLPDAPSMQDVEACCSADWSIRVYPMPAKLEQRRQAGDWQLFLDKNPPEKRHDDDQWIGQTLTWQYPFRAAVDTPSKVAASAIGEQRVLQELKRPEFMAEKSGYTAAERGSIIHRAMMLLDLNNAADARAISRQLQGYVAKGMMDAQQVKLVKPEALLGFAQSPLGRRAAAADRANTLMREQPFNLLVRACDVIEGAADEQLLVQGVVDMAFREIDGWVIVDYKTNRLTAEGVEAIARMYGSQMDIYSRALREISGLPVNEVYIYLLNEGMAVDMREYINI